MYEYVYTCFSMVIIIQYFVIISISNYIIYDTIYINICICIFIYVYDITP
jgi:hypothetical protein